MKPIREIYFPDSCYLNVRQKTVSIQQILKNTSYHLDLFSDSEIAEFEKGITTRQTNGKAAFYARCLIRDRDIKLKPEEVVRQL
jgi:type I restriction enzyme M protein